MSLPTACLIFFFSSGAATPPPEEPASVSTRVSSPASSPTQPRADAPDLLGRVDALHQRRDDRAALAEERQLLDAAVLRTPSDYAVLWRAARLYFWLSDDPSLSNEQRSNLGKYGWDLAERAITVDSKQAPAHYWAAVNMGNYALGLGVLKALTLGMEAKFRARLERAGQLAPDYEFGGIDVAWGRFYEKLPWPKRDRKKAEEHLRHVLTKQNPNNLRARVFLADTLANDGRAAEAKKLLDEVASAVPGQYDAPEERRAKALGVGLLPVIAKRLR